jgi:hypothetical protein
MENETPRIPYKPTPLEGVHVFRTVRALLKAHGLKCKFAEAYAKDAVLRYQKLMLAGQYEKAAAMLTEERASFYVRVHNTSLPMNLCETCGEECDFPYRADGRNICNGCVVATAAPIAVAE